MKFLRVSFKKMLTSLKRPATVSAVIVLAVIAAAGSLAEIQNRQVFEQRLRNDVQTQVSLLRTKLEGNITGNVQLVRGLVATISTEPDMDQDRFSALARAMMQEKSQLRNIAGAPDLVIRLMYPMAGNEAAIGLDYRTNPRQREAAIRARDTGEAVLAGPLELVQGGEGLIFRLPVYTGAAHTRENFWGIVSAVIDSPRLFQDSGLYDMEGLDIAVVGRDGLGASGEQFYGDPAVLTSRPVTAEVTLPFGSWLLAAVPAGGWNATRPDVWPLRLLFLAAAVFVLIPIVMAGRLVSERQQHIEELGQREVQLEVLSKRLKLALETSRIGVWELNLDTNELVWDARMCELYDVPPDDKEVNYLHWKRALHPEDSEKAEREFRQAIEQNTRYSSQFRLLDRCGRVRHVRTIGATYVDANGARKILGVNWDVSEDVLLHEDLTRAKAVTEARNAELETAKASIEYNALHDSLTGLPNRRYLDEVLKRLARPGAGHNSGAALLHIDLDRFKQINDTLGHAAGDAMLVHAAEVLKSNTLAGDFVARIGGDEFVIVRLTETSIDRLSSLATRIISEMRQPVLYEGHECRFGVSVGIARQAEEGLDPKRLLVNADIALYRAKSRGRNRYEFFTEALEAEIVDTKRLADQILSGLEEGQFTTFYQPQFDARNLDLVGVEALVRWRHPTRGLLTPDAFLGIAEELNVVSNIDRLVLEQALADRACWLSEGIEIPRVSVNVSARRLQDEQLIDTLSNLGIEPGTITFELVESIYLDKSEEVVSWNIDQIRELGIDIEIDDFGTGYASIVSLMKLRPRRLKVDRQLVMPIVDTPGQRKLVRSIIDIGKSLDIEVVAEGVETARHMQILRDLGCNVLQGYAFAKPMNAEDLKAFVLQETWRKAS